MYQHCISGVRPLAMRIGSTSVGIKPQFDVAMRGAPFLRGYALPSAYSPHGEGANFSKNQGDKTWHHCQFK